MPLNVREVQSLLGRFGKPEQEFSVTWTEGTTVKSPTSIKTDKVICFLIFEWLGRITIATADIAALTVDSLGQLLQEIRVYGTHAQFGAQTPIKLRGGLVRVLNRIYRLGYTPRDQASATWTGAKGSYDLRVFWTLPLFPLPISLSLAPLYSLKGPDWAGNLFVEVDCGNALALGGVVGNTSFTAYGSASGKPELRVSVVRPSLTVDLMNRISPAITFKSYKYLDNVVQGASFAGAKITDLNIGKRMASLVTEAGTLFAAGAGQRAYSAMSDAIITRIYPSLDGKPLVLPYDGATQQEWSAWLGGNVNPVGYLEWNFLRESANPDSGFPAETLTAARRFELDGDVAGAGGQGAVLVQEEVLGSPAIAA
jgi:hypothetical protein